MFKASGLAFASLLLLSTACTTKVDGLYVSDSFKPTELSRDALVSAGVVDAKYPLERGESNQYAGLLLAKIKDERAYVSVRPVETLIQAVGEDAYTDLLKQYTVSGLDNAALDSIAKKLPGIRFLALAKIEDNSLSKSETRTPATETKDKKGVVTKTPETLQKDVGRTILVSMSIYDLQQKNLAFSGQVSKTRHATETYTLHKESDLVKVVRVLSKGDTYPYPDAPGTRQVLGDIFKGFAENFPEQK